MGHFENKTSKTIFPVDLLLFKNPIQFSVYVNHKKDYFVSLANGVVQSPIVREQMETEIWSNF